MVARSPELVYGVHDREPALVVDRHAVDGERGADADAFDLAPSEEHDAYTAGFVGKYAFEARRAAQRFDAHRRDAAAHLGVLPQSNARDGHLTVGARRGRDGHGLELALAVQAAVAVAAAVAVVLGLRARLLLGGGGVLVEVERHRR